LIKHDFSTFDLTGRWGFQMADGVTEDGWTLADGGCTTAEAIIDLYRCLREAAGEDAVLLGCNTISHLAAGIFEMQRTGDDTSGKEWDHTRKMGVNCLAFRAPQHGSFYAVDADCMGLTHPGAVP
jgi:alpha-galactosidase